MLVLMLICRRVRLYRSFSRIIKVLRLLGFRFFFFFPQLQQRISQPTPSSALLFCCISNQQSTECGPSAHKHTHTSYRGFCVLDGSSSSIKIVVLKVSAGFQGQVALSTEDMMGQHWDHRSIRLESYVYSTYAFNVSYY